MLQAAPTPLGDTKGDADAVRLALPFVVGRPGGN
ncbi:UNVERIFIED_ORG: hypothetical protein CLV66_105107 [Actinomadura viridilutea]